MDIKVGDYKIISDERQFIVRITKKVTDKESKNYGETYEQNLAYVTTLEGALKFIPEQTIRSNDDIQTILKKLDKINEDIKKIK